MNLVELMKGQLSGDVISKIASTLGESPDATKTAVNAAVPTFLAGLAGVASSPDGARRLARTVDDHGDEGLLGNIGSMISSQASSLTQSGSNLLSSLFGGNALSGVTNALSKFTGMGGGSMTSLLALLAPLGLGLLKRQTRSQGLDASGLAGMLSGQRQNIAAAMPLGLGSVLSSVPGLDKLGLGQSAAYEDEYAPRQPAYASAAVSSIPARPTAAPQTAPSFLRWVLPLLILALAGWLIYSLANRGGTRQTPAPTPAPSAAPSAAPRTPIEAPALTATTLTSNAKDAFASLTNTFKGVTDADSAQAALPKIREATDRLTELHTGYSKLPAAQRGTIASTISTLREQLQPAIDGALALPGVGSVLKPAVDALTQRLDAFASP